MPLQSMPTILVNAGDDPGRRRETRALVFHQFIRRTIDRKGLPPEYPTAAKLPWEARKEFEKLRAIAKPAMMKRHGALPILTYSFEERGEREQAGRWVAVHVLEGCATKHEKYLMPSYHLTAITILPVHCDGVPVNVEMSVV